jgi:hypothetical protein
MDAISEPTSQRRSIVIAVIATLVALAAVAGCVTGIVFLLRTDEAGAGAVAAGPGGTGDEESGRTGAGEASADGVRTGEAGFGEADATVATADDWAADAAGEADGDTLTPNAPDDATASPDGIALPAPRETGPDDDGVITAPASLPGLEELDPDRFSEEYCTAWDEIPKLGDPPTPESVQARIEGMVRAQDSAYRDAAEYYQISIDFLKSFREFLLGDKSLREGLLAQEETFRHANIIVADSSIAACLF